MATCILASAGSDGDVFPLLYLGLALAKRNHNIVLIAHGRYTRWAMQRGWECRELNSPSEYVGYLKDVSLLTGRRRMDFFGKYYIPWNYKLFKLIKEVSSSNPTIVISQRSLKLNSDLIANGIIGVPLLSIFLEPLNANAGASNNAIDSSEVLFRREYAALDRIMHTSITERIRCVPRMRGPHLRVGLWPGWFTRGELQPHVDLQAGFPLSDDVVLDVETPIVISADILRRKPVVYIAGTPGTTDDWAPRFFNASISLSRLLTRPYVLLSNSCDALVGVTVEDGVAGSFAKLQELFSNSSGVVHHGGIGTCAAALAAGLPQVIVPRVFGQESNGIRMCKLGVAEIVRADDYVSGAALPKIVFCLTAKRGEKHIQKWQKAIHESNAVQEVCNLVDQMLSNKSAIG
ncbi:MAG: hypothetical protein M3O31_03880 [Acidobacteriota bacterium]|nr:hypothetical protein [Acidobacteriota bacterium]